MHLYGVIKSKTPSYKNRHIKFKHAFRRREWEALNTFMKQWISFLPFCFQKVELLHALQILAHQKQSEGNEQLIECSFCYHPIGVQYLPSCFREAKEGYFFPLTTGKNKNETETKNMASNKKNHSPCACPSCHPRSSSLYKLLTGTLAAYNLHLCSS